MPQCLQRARSLKWQLASVRTRSGLALQPQVLQDSSGSICGLKTLEWLRGRLGGTETAARRPERWSGGDGTCCGTSMRLCLRSERSGTGLGYASHSSRCGINGMTGAGRVAPSFFSLRTNSFDTRAGRDGWPIALGAQIYFCGLGRGFGGGGGFGSLGLGGSPLPIPANDSPTWHIVLASPHRCLWRTSGLAWHPPARLRD